MQLLAMLILMVAVVPPRIVSSIDVTCDCRLGQRRDTSIAFHCANKDGTSPVSCQKARMLEIPPGYEYVPGYGLLKLYRTFKTWWAAKEACEAEGSRLAIPPDHQAVDAMNKIFAKRDPLYWAFIGISDEAKEGVFVGVDGRPAPYLPWQPKQPSDHEGKENCINTRKDGLFNDLNCDWQSPYFCDRVLSVGVPDSYSWVADAGRFYKVHREKRSHAEAVRLCRAENATLAVPDTWRRVEAILRGVLDGQGDLYHIGFTDEVVEGDFVTESGRHLKDMEFREWANIEPNNDGGGYEEECMTLSGEGYYNDVTCSRKQGFICEILPV